MRSGTARGTPTRSQAGQHTQAGRSEPGDWTRPGRPGGRRARNLKAVTVEIDEITLWPRLS